MRALALLVLFDIGRPGYRWTGSFGPWTATTLLHGQAGRSWVLPLMRQLRCDGGGIRQQSCGPVSRARRTRWSPRRESAPLRGEPPRSLLSSGAQLRRRDVHRDVPQIEPVGDSTYPHDRCDAERPRQTTRLQRSDDEQGEQSSNKNKSAAVIERVAPRNSGHEDGKHADHDRGRSPGEAARARGSAEPDRPAASLRASNPPSA